MMGDIDFHDVKKQISVEDGRRLVLVDRLAMQKRHGNLECARNIYLMDSADAVIWQIHSRFDEEGVPFTGLVCEGGTIRAYRWDGGLYSVDMVSGFATPEVLAR